MSTIIVALLVFLTIHGASGISPRCQCLFKEKRPIGRFISTVEIYPANSYCKSTEIIATLKKEGQKICLDPNAPWVKQVLKSKKMSTHLEEHTFPDLAKMDRG